MSVRLCEITKATVRAVCALEVRDEQKHYVAANALSLAQAHFEPTVAFRAIHLCDLPIGFVQWRAAESAGGAVLWRFMIDKDHQGRGHGGQALSLALAAMKAGGYAVVETSVVLGPAGPLKFYLSQGFVEAGKTTPAGEWLLNRGL